jgi:hypothetical protein
MHVQLCANPLVRRQNWWQAMHTWSATKLYIQKSIYKFRMKCIVLHGDRKCQGAAPRTSKTSSLDWRCYVSTLHKHARSHHTLKESLYHMHWRYRSRSSRVGIAIIDFGLISLINGKVSVAFAVQKLTMKSSRDKYSSSGEMWGECW